MTSFELDIIDEKSRAGTEFMARVINEIRRALVTEKKTRKITQQAIAEKIGTSRAVVNRQLQGFENLSARRIGELLWAIGWEPHFEARKIPVGDNQFVLEKHEIQWLKEPARPKPFQPISPSSSNTITGEVRR
jgi:hypothetical protein